MAEGTDENENVAQVCLFILWNMPAEGLGHAICVERARQSFGVILLHCAKNFVYQAIYRI